MIDLYLLDKLSPQERKDFEEEMLRDNELHKEVIIMQRIMTGFERKGETEAIEAIHNMSEEQVKSIIADEEGKYKQPKQPAKKTWLFSVIAGVAASVALLLYIGFQPKYSSEELYNSFYAPFAYEYIPSRGGTLNDNQEHLMKQAIAEYNQESYVKALALFDSITTNINAGKVPEEVIFYIALCMAQTDKENLALEKMESIASLNDAEFKDDAQWNLALLYLKLGDRDKCRNLLDDIVNAENNLYANEASKLLDKLNTKRWF